MRRIALAATFLILSNCAFYKRPEAPQKRYQFQDQAGSVLVGVQSVAPFEAYIDALQPRFTLTTEDALRSALATTQIQELRELRALLLSIAVNLPTQTRSVNEELTRTGEETTSSRTETFSEASGAVPSASVPAKLEDVLDQLEDATTSISLDASLNYRAAAALLQEAALLSNYVRDAAVGVRAAPYVVRMLLTVFPSARRSPYDVYTSISFFGAPSFGGPFIYNRDIDFTYIAREAVQNQIEGCSGTPIKTIPLFVTDNLETSVLRSARGAAADVGGTLGGNVAGAGLGVGGRAQNESSAFTLGRGINALFTLGLASENTLAVRLGAVSSDAGYEMLPRTYNLTALVLVSTVSLADVRRPPILLLRQGENPDQFYAAQEKALEGLFGQGASDDDLLIPCTSVDFRAHSSFRDATDGSILPSRNQEGLENDLQAIGLRDPRLVEAVLDDDYESFRSAYRHIKQEEFVDFLEAQREKKPGEGEAGQWELRESPEFYWVAAVAARSKRGFASGSFEIPRSSVRFFTTRGEKIAIYDDGKVAYMQLSGAVGLVSKGLSGILTARSGKKSWTVYSTNAVVTNDGASARIEFPSVAQAARAVSLELKDIAVDVEITYAPPLQRWSPPAKTYHAWSQSQSPVVVVEQKPATVAFSLVPSASHVRAKADGTGQVRIEVRTTDKNIAVPEVRFAVEGGVVSATEILPAATEDGADLVLATNKIYTMTIGSLIPGNTLKIKAWRMDGPNKIEMAPISLAVFEMADPAPNRE